jgi:hypothetical protein
VLVALAAVAVEAVLAVVLVALGFVARFLQLGVFAAAAAAADTLFAVGLEHARAVGCLRARRPCERYAHVVLASRPHGTSFPVRKGAHASAPKSGSQQLDAGWQDPIISAVAHRFCWHSFTANLILQYGGASHRND